MKRIRVDELREDILSNLSDKVLMDKYDLSEEQLSLAFREMVKAVANGQTYIEIGGD